MTLDEYIAAFALGRVLTSELPKAAMQALEEGYDSVDLAALAGSQPGELSPSELDDLWRRGLRHLNKTVPGRAEAGRLLRRYYATSVVSGALAPRAGAAAIVHLATELSDVLPSREYAGDGLGLARLLGLYYSHDDVPFGDECAHVEIDSELKAECERLMREGAA